MCWPGVKQQALMRQKGCSWLLAEAKRSRLHHLSLAGENFLHEQGVHISIAIAAQIFYNCDAVVCIGCPAH